MNRCSQAGSWLDSWRRFVEEVLALIGHLASVDALHQSMRARFNIIRSRGGASRGYQRHQQRLAAERSQSSVSAASATTPNEDCEEGEKGKEVAEAQ